MSQKPSLFLTMIRSFFFLVLLVKRLSKCLSSLKSPLPWKISGWVPALRHYSFYKTLYLKCLTVFWIHLCLDNYLVICTVTLSYVLHQTWSYMQNMCIQILSMHIQYIEALFRLIQAYSALFVTLTYSQPYHIRSFGIFRTGWIFKTLWNFRHI